MHRASLLVDTAMLQVYDARCLAPTSGYDLFRQSAVAQIIVPRRGVFGIDQRHGEFVLDSGSVVVIDVGEVFRTRHPGPDGDDCTDVVPNAELLEEWSHGRRHHVGRLRPTHQLAVNFITRILDAPGAAPIEAEDYSLLLLAILRHAFSAPEGQTAAGTVSATQRARVDQVRELLASAPTENWRLATIAKAVHCSPFHLARMFRAVTSTTISQYLVRLRLFLAAERIAGGETNLSSLAIETGFAHQSHFTTRFRRAFGITPAAARNRLNSGCLGEFQRLVGLS
jgi:AraC-like DNA-binding protein